MRQILIEKYIEPSIIIPETTTHVGVEHWLNEDGDLHSLFGQPAEIFYQDAKIHKQSWHKKGIKYRDRKLPAVIWYNKDEKTIEQLWHKNGIEIKKQIFK